MFLFTTPNSPSPAPTPQAQTGNPITDAIAKGASATGTDFDYLLRTAKRESALDPSAKAPTSSATGLFQFIEQTWLGVVKSDGEKLGLPIESKSVVARPDGTFTVPDPAARDAILKLREQPEAAAAMAGALTRRNRESLTAAIGREPTGGELYLAHVLGARGASGLITTAQATPDRPAAYDFPEAARANRNIFFAKGGRPRSSAEVYAVLTAVKPGDAASPAAPTADIKLAATDKPPPGLQGLFQTGSRTAPLSDAVARIWRGHSDAAKAAAPGIRFFPRSDNAPRASQEVDEPAGTAAIAPEPIVVAAATTLPATAPLPPVRPTFDIDQIGRAPIPLVQSRPSAKVLRP